MAFLANFSVVLRLSDLAVVAIGQPGCRVSPIRNAVIRTGRTAVSVISKTGFRSPTSVSASITISDHGAPHELLAGRIAEAEVSRYFAAKEGCFLR